MGVQRSPQQQSECGGHQRQAEVPRVADRCHQRHGAHGPVAAERLGRRQQAGIHRHQVAVGQLARRPAGSRCRVVKSDDGPWRVLRAGAGAFCSGSEPESFFLGTGVEAIENKVDPSPKKCK